MTFDRTRQLRPSGISDRLRGDGYSLRRLCNACHGPDFRRARGGRRHGAAPRDFAADHRDRDHCLHRRDARRRQDLHGRRPRQQRAGVLVDGPDAARPRTQHPRHHQHATRLAVGRPVGRHVRRRRLHRPHRRLQLRLLRPRAHRSHPRPAGRAARQERGRWRAQHHHRGAEVRQFGRGDAVVRQLPLDHGVGPRHRRPDRRRGGPVLVPGAQARRLCTRRAAPARRRGPRLVPGPRPVAVGAGRQRLARPRHRRLLGRLEQRHQHRGSRRRHAGVRNELPAHELHASLEQPARVPRPHRPAREHRAEHPVQGQAAHQPVHGARRLRASRSTSRRSSGSSRSTR